MFRWIKKIGFVKFYFIFIKILETVMTICFFFLFKEVFCCCLLLTSEPYLPCGIEPFPMDGFRISFRFESPLHKENFSFLCDPLSETSKDNGISTVTNVVLFFFFRFHIPNLSFLTLTVSFYVFSSFIRSLLIFITLNFFPIIYSLVS